MWSILTDTCRIIQGNIIIWWKNWIIHLIHIISPKHGNILEAECRGFFVQNIWECWRYYCDKNYVKSQFVHWILGFWIIGFWCLKCNAWMAALNAVTKSINQLTPSCKELDWFDWFALFGTKLLRFSSCNERLINFWFFCVRCATCLAQKNVCKFWLLCI